MKFTKDHEWIRPEGNKGQMGITVYAAEQLGDVVYVELPVVGNKVTMGKTMGTIESVKTVSDLNSPVTGEVIAVNPEIEDNPALVNEDATGKGWLLEIKINDASELDKLMDKPEYDKICK